MPVWPGSPGVEGRGRLLWRSSWRALAGQPWQTGLTLLGITLGVAIVVAVDLANGSARRAFALSLESISGAATHQIVGGPDGIDEAVFVGLRTELGLRRSAPLVQGRADLVQRRTTLLGVDLFSERDLGRHAAALQSMPASDGSGWWGTDGFVLERRTAETLGLRPGQGAQLSIGEHRLQLPLLAVVDSPNPAAAEGLLFMDIALAQELLGRLGRLDRIDLRLAPDQVRQLRAWLPPGLSLLESEVRHDSLRQMSEAFHLNLTAMSLLALLVAALLIYNTVTFSVLRRRRVLGIYRALGVGRGRLFALIGGEALLMGALGSLAGVLLGLALGYGLVQLVTRTINDLYYHLHVTAFTVAPGSLLLGLALGLAVTAIAAALPAREAAWSPPVTVQQRSSLEQRSRRRLGWLVLPGVLGLFLGRLLLSTGGGLGQGFAGLVLQVAAYCLLVPAGVLLLARGCGVLLRGAGGSRLAMALRGIEAGISRTGLAVAALAVAVSVTVGVGVMVGSFRDSVAGWLGQWLVGDVYVASVNPHQLPISEALQARLAGLPGLDALVPVRNAEIETEAGPLRVTARGKSRDDAAGFQLLRGSPTALEDYRAGRGVLVSEPLAWRRQLAPGDRLSLHTAQGPRAFPVLGVFVDYSSSRGLIAIDLDLYRHWWRDSAVSGLVLLARPGGAGELAVQAADALAGSSYQATPSGALRAQSLVVFDRTFAITGVLRLLAIGVAFVGVLSALMALQLERMREYAILRATGMTPAEVGAQVILQTALLGLFAGLLALPLGLLMADVLIDVINRRSFGWTMQHSLPSGVLGEALLLAVTASLLAGVYPAWRAARCSPAAGLREE